MYVCYREHCYVNLRHKVSDRPNIATYYAGHYIELLCWQVQCHIRCTQNMHVGWKIVTDSPQMTRKLNEFAKMCCSRNTNLKRALRTGVTAVTLLVHDDVMCRHLMLL